MGAKTGWRGKSVHVDNMIRYKKAEGERLTLLSATKPNPINLQTEIHVDEVGASPGSVLACLFSERDVHSRS